MTAISTFNPSLAQSIAPQAAAPKPATTKTDAPAPSAPPASVGSGQVNITA